MKYIYYYKSPLGLITIASNENALTGLWFEGQKYYGLGLSEQTIVKKTEVIRQTEIWLDNYFKGYINKTIPKLEVSTTDFREKVLLLLQQIPYGEVLTYKQIGEELVKTTGVNSYSLQAIGQAIGHNPISIIIPCHRVIGSDNKLKGYAGGIERKRRLLQLEGIQVVDDIVVD